MRYDITTRLAAASGSNYELHREHINPQFAKALRTIGFDRCYERASGPYLWDREGVRYLDMIAGYGVFNIGRNHAVVRQALHEFLDLDYASLVQMDAPLASGLLAEEIKRRMPNDLDIVYFTNSGTEGVETAIKFARAATRRPAILHCKKAFHGLTNGSLALNGDDSFRSGFAPFLPDCRQVPYDDLNALAAALAAGDVAAFVVEPVQGKGVNLPSPGYLREAAALCRRHGALFVADEVQCGMGRTGRFLAVEHDGDVDPDIVILSKALSGGYVPVGAVITRRWIYDRVFASLERAVVHSSTFGQGSLAMVAGLATLAVMDDEQLLARAAHIGDALGKGLQAMVPRFEMLHAVRWRGAMVGIEFGPPRSLGLRSGWSMVHAMDANLFPQAVTMPLLQDHRVLTQVAGHHIDVIKLLPPLVLEDADIAWFLDAFEQVMVDLERFPGPAWEVLGRLAKVAVGGRSQTNSVAAAVRTAADELSTPAVIAAAAPLEASAVAAGPVADATGQSWLHRLARHAIRPLVGTWVSPNHLTTLRLFTGLGAAASFAVGEYEWTAFGGLLYMISFFLDRADGELARLSDRRSRFGHVYDLWSDAVVNVAIFVGMGIGLASSSLGGMAPLLGLVSGASIAAIFWVVTRIEQAARDGKMPFGTYRGFDPDDVLFIVGPAAWIDDLLHLLVASSIGAPLFLGLALWWSLTRN